MWGMGGKLSVGCVCTGEVQDRSRADVTDTLRAVGCRAVTRSSDEPLVTGSLISRAASTLRILCSPFSTSLLAWLYMYRPVKAIAIPKAWMGWTGWANHRMAMQMTATRLIKEAME